MEINIEEIKEAVSKRLSELDRDFAEMKWRGERFTAEFFLSSVASAVESAVRDVLKRYLRGRRVACNKYLWLLEGRAMLAVNCHVPGTGKWISVSVDPNFMTEIDSKLGVVAFWFPLNEWKFRVEKFKVEVH